MKNAIYLTAVIVLGALAMTPYLLHQPEAAPSFEASAPFALAAYAGPTCEQGCDDAYDAAVAIIQEQYDTAKELCVEVIPLGNWPALQQCFADAVSARIQALALAEVDRNACRSQCPGGGCTGPDGSQCQ